jgi:hypothetical protein
VSRQLHVLHDCQVSEQPAGLCEHTDAASPEASAVTRAAVTELFAGDDDSTAVGLVQAGQQREQRRLSGAGGPRHRDRLAGSADESDVEQSRDFGLASTVEAMQPSGFQRLHAMRRLRTIVR